MSKTDEIMNSTLFSTSRSDYELEITGDMFSTEHVDGYSISFDFIKTSDLLSVTESETPGPDFTFTVIDFKTKKVRYQVKRPMYSTVKYQSHPPTPEQPEPFIREVSAVVIPAFPVPDETAIFEFTRIFAKKR